MTKRTKPKRAGIEAKHPSVYEGRLKCIGGSQSDDFNQVLADQAVKSLWTAHSDQEGREILYQAALSALMGTAPRDEIEGMLVAQMVAAHAASMECFRRAMLPEQTFEGRKESLNQANKLSRTYTMLLEALNRHRGKGQQKVTVEHVHVHAGGQAIVGAVEQSGAGTQVSGQEPVDARQITHAPQSPLWSKDEERTPVPVAGDAERALPHARRPLARSTEG
jgi:hypothetical protein